MKSSNHRAENSKICAEFCKFMTAIRSRVANISALYAVFRMSFCKPVVLNEDLRNFPQFFPTVG
jgi:hypothetical protein